MRDGTAALSSGTEKALTQHHCQAEALQRHKLQISLLLSAMQQALQMSQ
jgi:hypothetical protein